MWDLIITYKLAATTIITSLHVIGDSWPYIFYILILCSLIQWSNRRKKNELPQLLIRIFAQKFAKKLSIARGLITSFCSAFTRNPKSSSAHINPINYHNDCTLLNMCPPWKSLVKGLRFIHFEALSYWRQSDPITHQPAFWVFHPFQFPAQPLADKAAHFPVIYIYNNN